MTDEELQKLEENVASRLSDFAECSKEASLKTLKLMYPLFSTKGAALYNISDRLDTKGY